MHTSCGIRCLSPLIARMWSYVIIFPNINDNIHRAYGQECHLGIKLVEIIEFVFERIVESFHNGIVIWTACFAHTLLDHSFYHKIY